MTGLYVYAISSRPLRLRARGIFGRPLRNVAVGQLHALVESATRPPTPSLARLKAQSGVLTAIVETGTDVLPTRFGTFASDRQELETVLHGRRLALRKALRQVRGCVQMTLRLISGQPVGESHAARKTSAASSEGIAYLRSRAARDRARREDPSVLAFTAAAEPLVRATRVEWSHSTAVIFHLVPRTKLTRYLAAMGQAAARVDARVVVSGPFAPFAFAELDTR